MSQKSNSSLNHTNRTIRVFVSSTFKDMKEEREILAKQIFPQIRKICEDRGVTFTDIDLRWGINDEQKAEGKVLSICLEEIECCRPYFIGILGERYGWIPEDIPHELIEQQDWLEEHKKNSITALEIIHGVLRNPKMKKNALFYFRSPAYIGTLSPDNIDDFIEIATEEEIKKFGREKATELAQERKSKLQNLKQEIKESAFHVTEYASPKDIGNAVLNDLIEIIDEKYPKDTTPDPHEQEIFVHEAFARERTHIYIEDEQLLEKLDKHASSSNQPLVILGESGCGKSALLANWVFRYREKHPDEKLFMHFIGATSSSTDWKFMLRRIMEELKQRFDIQQNIPEDDTELRLAFVNWIHMASARGKFILIIDALNQLEDKEGALNLVWLPQKIPENIRLFVSTLPGRSLDTLNERGWNSLEVPLLDDENSKNLIIKYLVQYRKTPTSAQVDKIVSYPQTKNPLYLRSLLDELRMHGDNFTVDERFDWYLETKTVEELFDKILTRWEEDYGSDRPGLVRDTMRYIWASRKGLSESELAGILGEGDDNPLPKAYWIPLYLAADKSLVNRSGLIDFFHEHLRNAVQKRYLSNEDSEKDAHFQLARYFANKDVDMRTAFERPWQLCMAEEWDELHSVLSDSEWLLVMWIVDEYDVKTCWKKLESNSNYRMIETYDLSIGNKLSDDLYTLIIVQLFYDAGNLNEIMVFFKEQGNKILETEDTRILHRLFDYIPLILRRWGRLEEAIELLKKQEKMCREIGDMYGLQASLGNQGQILQTQGQLEEAMELHKQEEKICKEFGFLEGIPGSLIAQGLILQTWTQMKEAMVLFKQSEKMFRELGNITGLNSSLNNQATLLKKWEQPEKAMELFQQVGKIYEDIGDNFALSTSLVNQAAILQECNKQEEAIQLLKKAEKICRDMGYLEPLAKSLGSQAMALQSLGDLENAMKLHKEEEQIYRDLDIQNGLQESIGNQALILQTWNKPKKAMQLLKEQETICREIKNMDPLQRSLRNQALILLDWNKLEEAEILLKKQEKICWDINYLDDLLESLLKQAVFFNNLAKLGEAVELYKKESELHKDMTHWEVFTVLLHDQAMELKNTGQSKKALQLLSKIEVVCKDVGYYKGIVGSLGNQAEILQSLGQEHKAMELYKEAEKISRNVSFSEGISISLGSQAVILKRSGRFEESMNLLKQQEHICRDSGHWEGLSKSLGIQAGILQESGNVQEAMKLHKEAEMLFRDVGYKFGLLLSLISQSTINNTEMKNIPKALELAEEAYALAEEEGFEQHQNIVLSLLGDILNNV